MGIWITPDTCKLRSSLMAPMFGASAVIWPSSRINQPTEAQRTVPDGSNDARCAHPGMGWALSSHSTITRGQEAALAELSLSRALREGRVAEFAELAEARLLELGFAPPDLATVDEALAEAITEPRSGGRTSRSQVGDGSTGR